MYAVCLMYLLRTHILCTSFTTSHMIFMCGLLWYITQFQDVLLQNTWMSKSQWSGTFNQEVQKVTVYGPMATASSTWWRLCTILSGSPYTDYSCTSKYSCTITSLILNMYKIPTCNYLIYM